VNAKHLDGKSIFIKKDLEGKPNLLLNKKKKRRIDKTIFS